MEKLKRYSTPTEKRYIFVSVILQCVGVLFCRRISIGNALYWVAYIYIYIYTYICVYIYTIMFDSIRAHSIPTHAMANRALGALHALLRNNQLRQRSLPQNQERLRQLSCTIQHVDSKLSECHFFHLILAYFYVSHLLAVFYKDKPHLEEYRYSRLQNLYIHFESCYTRILKSSFCAVDFFLLFFNKTQVDDFSTLCLSDWDETFCKASQQYLQWVFFFQKLRRKIIFLSGRFSQFLNHYGLRRFSTSSEIPNPDIPTI